MSEEIEANNLALSEMENVLGQLHQSIDAQLRQQQNALFQTHKLASMGAIAGGLAHELNNIIGAILGYASILKESPQLDEAVQKKLDIIISAASRGGQLTQNVLNYARMKDGGQKFCQVNKIIEETTQLLRGCLKKNVLVDSYSNEQELVIPIAENILIQILLNLGINGGDAMPNGGQLTIEASSFTIDENNQAQYPDRTQGSYIKITVSDTGTGIAEQYHDKIFTPFFTTKPDGCGTGLGLALVKKMMHAHNGTVNFISVPNKGTSFTLVFPAVTKNTS